MSGKWPRASKTNPCPLCGNTRLCHVLENGKGGRCYRPAEAKEPPYVHERGRDEISDFIHWYSDPPAKPGADSQQRQKREEVKRARPEDFRPVYERLLELCTLTTQHREHLTTVRKLSGGQIKDLRFASLPRRPEQRKIAATLLKEFGQKLFLAPGFVMRHDGPAIVADGSGIIIPHLRDGKIDGLQLRLDDVKEDDPRYKWISGGKNADKTPGASIFLPTFLASPLNKTSKNVIVTEGAFKALAAATHYGAVAIGAPGIGSIAKSIDLIKDQGGVVWFAPDADHAKANSAKPQVFNSTLAGLRALWNAGLEVKMLRWVRELWREEDPKGIDDAIEAGADIEILDSAEIEVHFTKLAKHFGREETIVAPPRPTRKKPVVVVNGRDPEHVDAELLRHLVADGRFYRRGEKVVCVTEEESGTRLQVQNHETMTFKIPKVVKLVNEKETKDPDKPNQLPVRPSKHLTTAALVGGGEIFPALFKVVDIPFFDREGRLVQKPGYDARSCIYYAPAIPGLTINPTPTRGAVEEAVEFIDREFFAEFAFADHPDKCHAFCALLQSFLVEIINARSPAYLFRANRSGSGKTFLAQCIGLVVHNGVPEVSEEEAGSKAKGTEIRKTLDTHLMNGAQGVIIDNVESDLNYPWLFQYLTSHWLEPRILGRSEVAKVPNRILWMITANTPKLKRDAVRRTATIKFDLGDVEPDERTFARSDLDRWLREHRKEVIQACLTIVSGWVAAGQPLCREQELDSFTEWSHVMGGLMKWLGVEGFLANRKSHQMEIDEEAKRRRDIIEAAYERQNGTVYKEPSAFFFGIARDAEALPPNVNTDRSEEHQKQQFSHWFSRTIAANPKIGCYRIITEKDSHLKKAVYTIRKIEQTTLNESAESGPKKLPLLRRVGSEIATRQGGVGADQVDSPKKASLSANSPPTLRSEQPLENAGSGEQPAERRSLSLVNQEREREDNISPENTRDRVYGVDIGETLRTPHTSGVKGFENRTPEQQKSYSEMRVAQLTALGAIKRLSDDQSAELQAHRTYLAEPATSPPALAAQASPPGPPASGPAAQAPPVQPRSSRLDDDDDLAAALGELL